MISFSKYVILNILFFFLFVCLGRFLGVTILSFVPVGAGFTGFPRSSVYLRYYLFVCLLSGRTSPRQENGVGGEPPEAFECSQGGHEV